MFRPLIKITSFLYGCAYTFVHSYHVLFPRKTFKYKIWRPKLNLWRLISSFRLALRCKSHKFEKN